MQAKANREGREKEKRGEEKGENGRRRWDVSVSIRQKGVGEGGSVVMVKEPG